MACLAPAALPLPLFQLPSPYLIRPTPPRSSSPPSPPPHPSRSISLSPEALPFQPRSIMVQWEAPPEIDVFKLNFDGSVYNDGSGRASIGGVIRDWKGCVIAAFAERTEHTTSVGIVEARALIRGLQLARSLRRPFLGTGITRLMAEGDDMVLVKLLNREDQYTRIPQAMEDEIRKLLRCFPEYEVKHTFREGNQVADALCRAAYHQTGVWAGQLLPYLPRAASEKAQDDALGVKYERIRKTKV